MTNQIKTVFRQINYLSIIKVDRESVTTLLRTLFQFEISSLGSTAHRSSEGLTSGNVPFILQQATGVTRLKVRFLKATCLFHFLDELKSA